MEESKGIEMHDAGQKSGQLRKVKIGPWGIAFMLYCLVAAGAFGIEEIIPSAGPGLTILILVLLPIVWARPISAMVSEANSLMPAEGGMYVWARETFGEFWGFQMGWWLAMDIYISAGAYIALAGGYAAQLLGLDPAMEIALKLGFIAVFTVINLVGLKNVEHASTVLSVIVLAVFAVITVVGFANWQTNPLDPVLADVEDPIGCLVAALTIGIWMYCGYDSIATMSGEYEDPNVIVKGFRIVLPLIALSYILPTIACLAAMPEGSWTLWSVDVGTDMEVVGYGTVLGLAFGPAGTILFMVAAIASQCVIYNAYLASGSRSFWALAEDGLFPKIFTRVDKDGRSPYISILTIAVSSAIFSQFDFASIIEMNIVFILGSYILLAFVVLKLRKTHPVEQRGEGTYYMKGKVLPGLSAVAVIALAVFTLCLVPVPEYMATLGFLATGVVAYVIFKMTYGGLAKRNPEAYPLNPKTRLAQGDLKRIGAFCLIALGLLLFNLLLNAVVVL